MIISEVIVRAAKRAIDNSQSQFSLNSLTLCVVEENEFVYEVGTMPSYFDYEKEGIIKRYVIYFPVDR